ncbi:MAG: carbamoyl-phosphate synthase large subunit [Christensenellales bacterium]|jgi:carbamoyl-phosphate synthase large subunit
MPRDKNIKKVLVIGSGPIIIGQAAEFDYAGTQACRALKEEGIEVVLVNSNPATIMTDTDIADKVYIEPLTVNVIRSIIDKERPDSMLATLGGQTGLNLAMELYESGILDTFGVKLLGTDAGSIKKAEDREAFKELMDEIGEPIIESVIAGSVDESLAFARVHGYPLIVRPAYTLGGTGGGIAYSDDELIDITKSGIFASRVSQVLIEKSVAGYKEIEYEVIRDSKGNCITVCNMENIDPVGIHTGDSIVVAPSQTLRDEEYQLLRTASLNIISALEIKGGCNVQFALDTESMHYYVIEVNPRVSRSSALASKATGYPIAKVAAKIAIGFGLDEIRNGVTGKTFACFEPTLDYVVIKFPRWPFDKFTTANKQLGTKMKATGEVMAIGSNFESAFLKAVRSLELNLYSLVFPFAAGYSNEALLEKILEQDDDRIFLVAMAIRRGIPLSKINELTKIDLWYLTKFKAIIDLETAFAMGGEGVLTFDMLKGAKRMGFSDNAIAAFTGKDELYIRQLRKRLGILPTFKMVDTCGAEFDAQSPYYYSTYDQENEAQPPKNKTVVVLGSGPIRIGQGIEFDYCSVHCVWALKRAGYDTVIVNNNPETVSTDFDTSDRLYFEPLTPEEVGNILEQEEPEGVVVQFGGQTAIKLAKYVEAMGYRIIGTSLDSINRAEDRKEFEALLEKLNIKRPKARTVFTEQQAVEAACSLGYPVLVRPSYVLGGQGMEIAWDEDGIHEYMRIIGRYEQEHPVLIDKYMTGLELEVDAICDGEEILIPGIMEHIERAGVHSGDSISVYPARKINGKQEAEIIEITRKLALALDVRGIVNIQFVISGGEIYVIEVNPRSSRTVPYISKVTGIPMIALAVRVSLGEKLSDMEYGTGLYPKRHITAVKVPVFSFEKLPDVEVGLGPEMKSTGEVLGISTDYSEALLKGLIASGLAIPNEAGSVLLTVADNDKQELIPIAAVLDYLGYDIYATTGTAHVLNFNFVAANAVPKLSKDSKAIKELVESGQLKMILNTPTKGRRADRDGFKLRRLAVEHRIPCITSLDTAKVLLQSLKLGKTDQDIVPVSLSDIGS